MDNRSFVNMYLASPTYIPETGVVIGELQSLEPINFVTDRFSGTLAGWSVRKLRDTYNGPCVKIRRTSDNQYKDIGFVNNYIDLSEINSFLADEHDTARVFVWYDQIGSYDLSNYDYDYQPYLPLTPMLGDKVALDFSVNKCLFNNIGPNFQYLTATFRLNTLNHPYNGGYWPSDCTILETISRYASEHHTSPYRNGTAMAQGTRHFKDPLPLSVIDTNYFSSKNPPFSLYNVAAARILAIRPNHNLGYGHIVGNYTRYYGGNHYMSEIVIWNENKESIVYDIIWEMNNYFNIFEPLVVDDP